uniref:Uncharacterized protein n=1 Tax=Oryza rufipogon TaxID=4529 RepID=A0A0E0QQF7_ORYRU
MSELVVKITPQSSLPQFHELDNVLGNTIKSAVLSIQDFQITKTPKRIRKCLEVTGGNVEIAKKYQAF